VAAIAATGHLISYQHMPTWRTLAPPHTPPAGTSTPSSPRTSSGSGPATRRWCPARRVHHQAPRRAAHDMDAITPSGRELPERTRRAAVRRGCGIRFRRSVGRADLGWSARRRGHRATGSTRSSALRAPPRCAAPTSGPPGWHRLLHRCFVASRGRCGPLAGCPRPRRVACPAWP